MAITRLNSLAIPAGTVVSADLTYPLTTFSSTGIDDNATSTAITIDSSQNVTVGGNFSATKLTALNGTLELDDNGTHNGIINVPASLFINIDSDNTNTGEDFVIAKDRTSASGGTELFRVQEDGNVGIGTASPDGKLNVFSASAGTVTADADADELVLENSGNVGLSLLTASTGESGIYFGNPGTNGQKDFYLKYYHESHATTANRRAFTFNTASTERMRIDSSGQVGIGITPSYTLDIQAIASSFNPVRFSGHSSSIDAFLYTDTAYWSIGDTAGYGGNLWGGNKTSNFIHAHTNGAERMRIDSNGNVGIGTSSINASYRLNVEGAIIPILAKSSSTGTSSTYACVATARPLNVVGNGSGYGMNMNNSSGSMAEYGYIGGLIENNTASSHSGALIFAPTSSGTRTERMRIDSSGNVLIGVTTSVGGGSEGIELRGDAGYYKTARYTAGSAGHWLLYNSNGNVGSVTTSNSSTQFNTSSDERLKENIVDAPAGNIDAIRVRSFDWKVDGLHQTYGMVAQELVDVAPEAVTQGETEDDMWSVDYSKLVPMMIKEIQDLKAEVAALKGA